MRAPAKRIPNQLKTGQSIASDTLKWVLIALHLLHSTTINIIEGESKTRVAPKMT